MNLDPNLLYQHPGVSVPTGLILDAITKWVLEHEAVGSDQTWWDANATVQAGDPASPHILSVVCEGIYEWPDRASMGSHLRDSLFLHGVHLESVNGYTLGVYRWEPVHVPRSWSVVVAGTVTAATQQRAEELMLAACPNEDTTLGGSLIALTVGVVLDDGGRTARQLNENLQEGND